MDPLQLPSHIDKEIDIHRPGESQASPYRLSYVDRLDSDSTDDDFRSSLRYWQILCRHKGSILVLTILGAGVGFLLGMYRTPVYRARTSLEIRENRLNPLDVLSSNVSDYELQTQVKLLQSDSLKERVVPKLAMPPGTGLVAQPESWWRQALHLASPTTVSLREEVVAVAAASLKVTSGRESPIPDSRILEITCSSTDPQVAADFVNNLVEEYIQQCREERWNVFQQTGEWLQRAQEDLKGKLEKSEERLHNFALESGLLITSEKDNVAEERLRQLQAELSKAQADRIIKQAQFGIAASGSGESLSEGFDKGPSRQYEVQLADLRRQLAELSSSLTPAHYKVQHVQAQITELESILAKERQEIIKRLRSEYESALSREKLLASDYAGQSKLVSDQAGKLTQYHILKREVDTNRQLYEVTLQKGKEASINSALHASNARVVDRAKVPEFPYQPDRVLYLAMGLLGGLSLGSAYFLGTELFNRSLRAPGDIPLFLNVRELGAIPSAEADPEIRSLGRLRLPRLLRGSSESSPPSIMFSSAYPTSNRQQMKGGLDGRVELVTWTRKPSLMAESFRATLASIQFSGHNGSRPKVILLTSPSPREGKSTVSSNLGIALAEINRRVLLIDADMRRPRLHSIFDQANSWGLSDLLRERTSIEGYPVEALALSTEVPGLCLLPSGPGTAGISNLLHSTRLSELLLRLRREFDTVLIDTAPMLQIPDARVIGRMADAVILVFRAGLTTREAALAATQLFEGDGTRVLGTILNDWNPRAGNSSYATAYSYYYHNNGMKP
jgi:capsular exopolysaccharide synthesis family protein